MVMMIGVVEAKGLDAKRGDRWAGLGNLPPTKI